MKVLHYNIVKDSDLPGRLKELGYDIEQRYLFYIPYGKMGYSNYEGMLTDGEIPNVSYFDLENVIKYVKETTEFDLRGKLKERGFEVDDEFVWSQPTTYIDGRYSYNLENTIVLLEKIKEFDLSSRLKEEGYSIEEFGKQILRRIPFDGAAVNSTCPIYDIEEVISFLDKIKAFNLVEKLKEAGYNTDKIDADVIKNIPLDIGARFDSHPAYKMEEVKLFLEKNGIFPEKRIEEKLSTVMKIKKNESGYFGKNPNEYFGIVENIYSRFPISKWYAEKYNTIPDVFYIGQIYIWELLEENKKNIKWYFKTLTGYNDPGQCNFPDVLRTFSEEQAIETIVEAMIELEDGMMLLLTDGRFRHKDSRMYATAILFYKEGIHDPSEFLKSVADEYVVHYDETGTLGLLYADRNGFNTQDFTIPKPEIDFELNYNKGFESVHKTIYAALSEKKGKGLVLLHGKPGSGKTTYIRYLINLLNKNKIFVPPNLTEMLSDPGFIPFLMENSGCVLFVEDAENVLRNREDGQNNQAVSNVLNITDGLLSDCLNIQIVATFNTNLKNIDEALLRKGRLIAQYEFKDLEPERAEKLADSLGVWLDDTGHLTLADIYALQTKKAE